MEYRDVTDKKKIIGLLAAIAVAGLAAVGYYQHRKSLESQEEAPVLPAPSEASNEPQIRNPVPEAQPAEPLPELGESDATVKDALGGLFGQEAVSQFLTPKDVVRRIVVTIDNLPRKKVAVELRPVVPTTGTFITSGSEDSLTLNPNNYSRYAPVVRLLEAADTRQLVAIYFHLYPLFQRAYEDLGYPTGYFNDRLVEVIDHLLAAPAVKGPINLTQPRVFYEFADPELEARSAGQKVLIRMGSENAGVVKAKLREIRNAVAGKTPSQ